MAYAVYEMFYSLQGEGANAGRAAVFCRFAGCNLWSGREQDRAGADCTFCDTEFVGTDGDGGAKFSGADSLADAIAALWPQGGLRPFVVLTGGEPALQVDAALITALHVRGFEIAMETNGTEPVADGIDWLTVSPKGATHLVQLHGDELKLVYPQDGVDPETFADMAFAHFFLQPLHGEAEARNTEAAVAYCHDHPHWRLSLQTHKLLGIR